MKFEFTRPIAFIDIESTGKDRVKDRIVELAICRLSPDMTRGRVTWRFNPRIPIAPAATEVHGINDADVAECPSFEETAGEVLFHLEGCDLAGFNSNMFDFPMLFHEFARAGINWDYAQHQMIDVGNIFKIHEPRTLSAAVKFYTGRDLEGAHGAAADIEGTVDVFLAQLERYPELPETADALALHSNYGKAILDLSGCFAMDENGRIVFNFGVKKGLSALENMNYVEWMYYKADFSADTRKVCEFLFKQRNPNFLPGF